MIDCASGNTGREDYSEDGNAWDYFSHDQSRSRAYRWGEDGIGGICDDKQQLCFALALWNERSTREPLGEAGKQMAAGTQFAEVSARNAEAIRAMALDAVVFKQ